MQNLFRYFLAALVCAFVFGLGTNANAQGPEKIRMLYQKMDGNLNTLKTLRTGIRMEKYNVQLKDYDDRRQGLALVIPMKGSRNANFLLKWEKGANEILSVVDGKYKLYQPALNQVIVGKNKDVQKGGGGAENAFKLINMSAKDLKANFDAKWNGAELVADIHSAWKITLIPKTAMQFDRAEVWINEEGMVVQFKVYDKNGDWTNVLLFDTQKNAKISKDDLIPKIPAGTKSVKG